MLPLSYQGFGFTAIMLMLFVLCVVEAVKWLRGRTTRPAEKAHVPAPLKEQIRRDPVGK
jgi:hypothetical protein